MKWSDYKIDKITLDDKNYPESLKSIKSPPKALYCRGNLKCLSQKSLAVVGSRNVSRYGRAVIDKFIPALVVEKVVIVSGFMYGVDTLAHEATVAEGGVTVAVLASGLNQFYPPENDKLYTKILQQNGVIISEYEPEAKTKLWAFPQRNRIVAGLSTLGVLVIEAGEKSGSLITANYGKEFGKKVFAVPGPITSPTSKGTNWLIKEGATLVTGPGDILGVKSERLKKSTKPELSGDEAKIYESLSKGELSIDELSIDTGINVVALSSILSMMSLKGLVQEIAGKYYAA